MCKGDDRDLSFRHKHMLYLIVRKYSWSLQAVCVGSAFIVVSLCVLLALSRIFASALLDCPEAENMTIVIYLRILQHNATVVRTESSSQGGLFAWDWLLLLLL